MNIKRLIISLLLIILLASTTAFGADVPLGPYFSDTYFDLSGSALILKIVPHEKGGLEADVSAYDGLILITGGATSNLAIGIADDNIIEMDDADAAVDDYCKLTANGIVGRSYSEVKTDLSLNYVENLKVKLDGTAAPTVNDDTDLGYAVGSRWFDITNDKEYVCLDNTDGAAVWTETTGAGGGAGTYLELTDTPATYDNGKYAKSTTDGVIWDTPTGGGTVTTSGTPVANDIARFTGATVIEGLSYSEFKAALDLEIGTDIQAFDNALTSISGLTYVSPSLIKLTANDTYAVRTLDEVKIDLSLNNVSNVATDDTAYNATSWDANSDAATKNAIRDKIETMGGGGETNTASNIGAQIEIYKQKTGVNLELRTLKADSNQIIVSTTPEGGEIDMGDPATNRGQAYTTNTVVSKTNPANAAGTITSVEIWANNVLSNVEVATFFVVTGDNLSTRDTYTIGTVDSGSKQTKTVDLDVEIGDFIGIYFTSGSIDYDWSGGVGILLKAGDNIPCTDAAFSPYNGQPLSLYATGVTSVLDYIRFDVVEENIRLDDFKETEDNTDLDASTSAHGLLPKLPNDAKKFIDGTGTWAYMNSDDLSDVASIAMLDEAEDIAGAWTVSGSIAGVNATEFGYLDGVTSDIQTQLDAKKGKNYYSALGSDHTYSDNADTDSQPVGESVVFGDLLYFNWTDKEWKKTDADTAATVPGERIALESKTDGQTCLMLVKGYIRDDSAFEFAGSMVYTSVTPGAMSSTAPTETGDQVQRVGTAKSADILFFNPSIDVGEI